MHIKVISRGKGMSAVAAAAYRAGELIKNDYDGVTHDYTRKGGVVHIEIMLPENAPVEYSDRAVLWNAVEKIEKGINSQLSREVEFALPAELTREQNIQLARDYVKRTFVDAGMCADICIHDKDDGKPHCHVLLTVRSINDDGTWGSKQKKEYILDNSGYKQYDPKKRQYKCRSIPSTDWNEQTKAEEWRKAWEHAANEALKKADIETKIDHRSYIRQGVDIVPSIKLGTAAFQMEKRGICTERGDINREIIITNNELAQLRARLNKLKKWLYAQPLANAPSMSDVLKSISDSQQLASRAKKIANLKALANIVNFLQDNKLSSIEQLADKVASMHQQRYDLAGSIKKQERRISLLDKHIEQAEINKRTQPIYRQYISLDPKKQPAFKERYTAEIRQYEESHKYLAVILNGRTTVPEKEWRAERDQLLRSRYDLVEQYYDLKEDVRSVEVIKRSAIKLMSDITPEQAPSRTLKQEL